MNIKVMLLGEKNASARVLPFLRDEEISVVASVDSEPQVLDEINRTSPDVVLAVEASPMTLRACNQIYLLRPRSIPIMIADTEDVEVVQRLLEIGVHYVLPSSMDPNELVSEIKSAYANESNRIMSLASTGTASSKSKVIMLFGAADGIGKTTLAVNLAVCLAQRKNRVAVLDYDMQFGSVGYYLGVETRNTITELIQAQANPNVDTIRQYLSFHMSGVNFLAAPTNPEDAKVVSPNQAERIIAALRVYYDYIIIDTAAGFDDVNMACIDNASTILLVTGNDIPSLRNTRKSLSILKSFVDESKLKLVVGRDTGMSIRRDSIEQALSMMVWETVPEDARTALNAANQGVPLVSGRSRSKVAREIFKMADMLDSSSDKKRERQK